MIEEEMLRSYINMSSIIKENRLLNDLSFNEIMVMNLIVEEEMPFKVLQKRLNILKSQLNRIINDLKTKGLIETYIPLDDKRMLMIKKSNNIALYFKEHEKMLKLNKHFDVFIVEKKVQISREFIADLNKMISKN